MVNLVVQSEENGPASVDVDGVAVSVNTRDESAIKAVSQGEVVGIEQGGNVIWCRRSQVGLQRIPFGDVISVCIEIGVPEQAIQNIKTVCVEGPQDKVPARIDVSHVAASSMRVEELPLPLYCETVGLQLNQLVFERVTVEEMT